MGYWEPTNTIIRQVLRGFQRFYEMPSDQKVVAGLVPNHLIKYCIL